MIGKFIERSDCADMRRVKKESWISEFSPFNNKNIRESDHGDSCTTLLVKK